MNYFWVNVGISYDEVLTNHFLWAPIPYIDGNGDRQTSAGWLNVPTISAGDVIFCNRDKHIIAIGVAKNDAYPSRRPESREFDQWKSEGYRVDIDITVMEPTINTGHFLNEFIEQFNSQTEPLLLNVNHDFCQQYAISLPYDAGKFVLEQCIQDTQVINKKSNTHLNINDNYPRESGKSWLVHSERVAQKTADTTLINEFKTGVPKDMLSFFTKDNFDTRKDVLIPLVIDKKEYEVTLHQKIDGRHILKLSGVKKQLKLKELTEGKDSVWFEMVDGSYCVYTTCKKSQNSIKPGIKKPTGSTSTETKSKSRVGQSYFKQEVSRICKGKCVVSGVKDTYPISILIGSHIKPWEHSMDDERLDGYNGLLLAPHIDKLFDKYLITFSDEKKILVSKKLDPNVLKAWNIDIEKKYKITAKHLEYMKYHRRKFKDTERSEA